MDWFLYDHGLRLERVKLENLSLISINFSFTISVKLSL